jgi:3-hydroxyisobutyrate dehydrogenase-like beta-hydroxyacid dehydrogenase
MVDAAATVGILYPGEMGSALGRVLRGDGLRVVTTLQGRGPRTRHGCEQAGLEVLDTPAAVCRAADVLLSVVPPAAARDVAESCAGAVGRDGAGRLYVDLNSVAPETAQSMAAALAGTGVDFVDGAVHGLAARLPGRGTVYLSGPAAGRAAALLGRSLRVRVLGPAPGTASAFKMLVGGLNKGVVALFLEMSLAARAAGLLDEYLGCCRDSYPGVLDVVERTLPTYPRHAGRRGEEMAELERMLRSLGLRACLARGARDLLTEMGRLHLAEGGPENEAGGWDVPGVIAAAYAAGLLS